MQFTDAVTVAGVRRREDGYLVADARIARTGIQVYLGSEVGREDMATVRVYRPGDQVFSDETMKSAAHRPVTNDHPAEMVTADNWKQHAVGHTGDEIKGEGKFIRVPMMVSDAAAIKDIEAGKRELSAGYVCALDWTPGTTPDGEAFDAIQKDIRLNHVAIVARGRAGSEVRIGDGANDGGKDRSTWGAAPITVADTKGPDMPDNLRKVMVDGLQVETTDAGAAAIEKLTKDSQAARTALADAETKHAEAIKAKDADLAKKDAEIDALKAKVLSDADLDKRVQARADLIATVGKIAKDVKTEGLSDADIRKAVVTAKLGDTALADKSEAYIDARFDILVEEAGKVKDGFAAVVAGGVRTVTTDASADENKAYAAFVADLNPARKENA